MKTTPIKVLSSSAMYFALVATAAACGPSGGGYRPSSYPVNQSSYNSYPSQYSSTNRLATTNQLSSNAARQQSLVTATPVTPVAPQARITTISDSAPVGRLQIASPVVADTTVKPTIKEVSTTTPSTEEVKPSEKTDEVMASTKAAIEAKLASLKADSEKSAPISESLKGLVGTWMAVSRDGGGELSTVELQLDDHGWAKLTVPGSDGKSSTTTRKAELENNELKLTGGDAEIMLGKLVDFNSRQMVLERSGSQVTFVRP
jgi:hypothetical protein